MLDDLCPVPSFFHVRYSAVKHLKYHSQKKPYKALSLYYGTDYFSVSCSPAWTQQRTSKDMQFTPQSCQHAQSQWLLQ